MNYETISKKYSKSHKLLEQWKRDNCVPFRDRDLYDFFDEQGIFAMVNVYWNKKYKKLFNAGILLADSFETLRNEDGTIAKFKTRTEAEADLFEKCFEILERKLQ